MAVPSRNPIVPMLWLFGVVLLVGGFVVGFVWFCLTLPVAGQVPFVERAHAIVVFTGSQARIPTGITLWRKGVAPRLLVSGVYRRTSGSDLVDKEEADKIALGRAARNTFENAVETVLWTNKNNMNKIILVTSDAHMRRSLLYLQCLAPDLEVVPFAVAFPRQRRWERNMKEYAKYLLAVVHCRFAALPEAFPTPQEPQKKSQEDSQNR